MKKKERSASEKRDRLLGVATAAPAAILLCVFTVYPVIYLIYRSLYSGSLISLEKEFVGLDNYKEILFDETFHKVLVNTIIYTVLFVGLTMVLAIIIAVWLNSSRQKKLNNMVEACIFTPPVISLVSVSIVFLWLMEPDTGFFNMVLTALGMDKFPFLSSPSTAMLSLVLVMMEERGILCAAGDGGVKNCSGQYLRSGGAGQYAEDPYLFQDYPADDFTHDPVYLRGGFHCLIPNF